MTRLTKVLREKMVNNALKTAGITEGFAVLRARRAKLADDVRVFALGGADKIAEVEKAIAKIKKIHSSGAFKGVQVGGVELTQNHYMSYCNLAGASVRLYFNGDDHNTMINREWVSPLPRDVTLLADNPLVKEFHSIANDSDTLISRRDGLRAQVTATLNQFTTIKKLLEQWPEAKDLLPKRLEESKSLLPVVQVKDLNCLIGLPCGGD